MVITGADDEPRPILGGTRLLEGASTAASVPVDPRLHRHGDRRQRGRSAARPRPASRRRPSPASAPGFIVGAEAVRGRSGPTAFFLNAVLYGVSFLIYWFGVEDPAGEAEAVAARARTASSRYVALVRTRRTSGCWRRPGSPSTPPSGCGSASRSSSSRRATRSSPTSADGRASSQPDHDRRARRSRSSSAPGSCTGATGSRPSPDDDHPATASSAAAALVGGRAGRQPLALGLPLVGLLVGGAASPPSACSCWRARRRPRSGCWPTCPSASPRTAARSWACTRSSSRSARSAAR